VAETRATIPDRELLKAAEVCEIAGVQSYVLRSWEMEFPSIGTSRTPGGPRVYRQADVERILRIKNLVFSEGLTLAGARRRLEEDEAPAEREGEGRPAPRREDPLLAEAATAFDKALRLARDRGARTVELRAAASLFRLRRQAGEAGFAREALAEALGRFREGEGTPLIASARDLLRGATDGVRS
jgi:DNA-binding transcriptional MerR regulator